MCTLAGKQSRDESVGLGSEGSRSDSQSWFFALPKYLTSYRNFPSKGAEIVTGAAV